MSLIGQQEPAWKAVAYVNGEQKVISSDDYKGKWHVLYWYPLDFTFVCPTEIKGFQSLVDDFKDDERRGHRRQHRLVLLAQELVRGPEDVPEGDHAPRDRRHRTTPSAARSAC